MATGYQASTYIPKHDREDMVGLRSRPRWDPNAYTTCRHKCREALVKYRGKPTRHAREDGA